MKILLGILDLVLGLAAINFFGPNGAKAFIAINFVSFLLIMAVLIGIGSGEGEYNPDDYYFL